MNRRTFLHSAAAASLTPMTLDRIPLLAASRSSGARITKLTLTPIDGRFHKFVTMNSYDTEPKGHSYTNTLIRVFTDQGVEGVGVMEYALPNPAFLQAVRALVGVDVHDVYTMENGRVTGRAPAFERLLLQYPFLDSALFDLLGKLEKKPAWQLIGSSVRDRVDLYDGTLYFSDIWFADRGTRAVVEEAEEAAKKGYTAVKLKTGRGWKWMDKETGLRRDIDVTKSVRASIGNGVKIMVDANNGYQRDIEDTWRFLEATAADNVFFMEEPFPESVEQYTRLRERIAAAGLKTLIADGENLTQVAPFRPYVQPKRIIDVLQMDIRRGGFLGNLELARLGAPTGAVTVPHNWGSRIGFLMALHFAKVVPNVIAAEDDRSTCDAIVEDGYHYSNGQYTVSDAPGLGIRVDGQVYNRKYAAKEQRVE
ncbi:MAG: enolase C-terminal domain-like protein [bacterium]